LKTTGDDYRSLEITGDDYRALENTGDYYRALRLQEITTVYWRVLGSTEDYWITRDYVIIRVLQAVEQT